MINITLNNKIYEVEHSTKPIDLIHDEEHKYLACSFNGRLIELNKPLTTDGVIVPLDNSNYEVNLIYKHTLRYIVLKAINEIDKQYKVKMKHSVSRSIFCYVTNASVDYDTFLIILNEKIEEIIQSDLPITRITYDLDKVKSIYTENNDLDKLELLQFRKEQKMRLYECDGYHNYMHAYLAPSTGYIKKFKIIKYGQGFLLMYPRSDNNVTIPSLNDDRVYLRSLQDASSFSEVIDSSYIASINNNVKMNKDQFIYVCELYHDLQLNNIVNHIVNNDIKLIAISGPSSSGKTTFSHRLTKELKDKCLTPTMLSLDDYYFNREDIPVDKDGKVDLEHINTIDVDMINKNLKELVEHGEASVPSFDFTIEKRVGYHTVYNNKNTPIIIEGIHALNEQLSSSIDKDKKILIYISPQLQINYDNHNPISISNLRLIRRIVRDAQFRNTKAVDTMDMWESVRKGEFTWIYPHQRNADFIYNSSLQYELCVLKDRALKLLYEIPSESKHYMTANRLIKFLKYFTSIDECLVPNRSILKEFIG